MRSRGKKIALGAVGLLVVGLIALRLALPGLVQDYVNDKLDSIPEYDGHVGDIEIHLYQGAYSIKDVDVEKTTGNVPVPFFAAERVKLSVSWRELFHGAIVGEIRVFRGKLNFVKGETREESQTSIDQSWLQVVQDLFPFRINRFDIVDGEVRFNDFHTNPKVDLFLTNVLAVATNIYNTRDLTTELPADFRATGTMLGDGKLDIHVKLDPLTDEPKFDLELALVDVNLTELNDLLEAYGKFNVKRGTFDVFSEIAGENGEFDGYVKPFFKDLDVLEFKQDAQNPVKLVWQTLVAGAVKIFKNHPEDQVATKIPVHGTFEKTQVDYWRTIVNILRNAFIKAFQPNLDESIDLFQRDKESTGKEKPMK